MSVKLNSKGEAHARSLIAADEFTTDSGWSISAAEENAMLGKGDDWAAYAAWHLGENTDAAENTKARYDYPFGKDGKVYRSALIAIRSRAAAQGATSIFEAAGALIKTIDKPDGDSDEPKDTKKNARFAAGTKRVEIFAAGKWNGLTFGKQDLEDIKSAFYALGDNHRVPLKFGHNDEQPLTDGQPALGWVTGLSVEGDKLVADFSDIPPVVETAMERKLYRNVSVELDFNVKYKNAKYPIVLSGVALLGADIPAVNTLKDLTHYLGRNADFSVGDRAVFSAIAGTIAGDTNMDLKELQDKVFALERENKELKTANEKFAADAKAATEAAAKEKLLAKRKEVNQILEDGVSSEAITPALRDKFARILKVDDDAALAILDIAEVRALVGEGTKKGFSRPAGKQGSTNEDDRPADVIVAERAQELVDKKEAANLIDAQEIVFRRDPVLAKAWVGFNGEK